MEKSIRREANVERSFCKRLREAGCLVYKFVSPGNDGVPDRIVVMPGGRVIFVELKTERGKLEPIQKFQCLRLACEIAGDDHIAPAAQMQIIYHVHLR